MVLTYELSWNMGHEMSVVVVYCFASPLCDI